MPRSLLDFSFREHYFRGIAILGVFFFLVIIVHGFHEAFKRHLHLTFVQTYVEHFVDQLLGVHDLADWEDDDQQEDREPSTESSDEGEGVGNIMKSSADD
jgi:hypothetical protein